MKTLGVLLFGVCSFASIGWAQECSPKGEMEIVQVAKVIDGDTLVLSDGRSVRVLGINAPEVKHGNDGVAQALGEEARAAAVAFFNTDKKAQLYFEKQRLDRYGRALAHVYSQEGKSLGASLLRSGLAFHVVIPPNTGLHECYVPHEKVARDGQLGVWGVPAWNPKPARSLNLASTGFQRVYGRVLDVKEGHSVLLNVDGVLTVKVGPADLKHFPSVNWSLLKGELIEVRGWVTKIESQSDSRKRLDFPNTGSPNSLMIQPRVAHNLELLTQ